MMTIQMRHPDFAGDMVMMEEMKEVLQHNVKSNNVQIRWGPSVNWKESKVMRVNRRREECQVMNGGDCNVPVSSTGKYTNRAEHF